MNRGDYVVRQSYGGDIVFRVEELTRERVLLRGVLTRLMADSPITDLRRVDVVPEEEQGDQAYRSQACCERLKQFCGRQVERMAIQLEEPPAEADVSAEFFDVPGKVLHLDGDPNYLRKSMKRYGELRVPAVGHYVQESMMADALQTLLPQVRPDILVITGHDGLIKHHVNRQSLLSYKNSHHFVRAVQVARNYERHRDVLTIVAGACQSHFEALLAAGANFASSPGRILIHALDPVYIACKVSYTSIRSSVDMQDIVKHTVSGLKGMGGIETLGSYRLGLPKLPAKA